MIYLFKTRQLLSIRRHHVEKIILFLFVIFIFVESSRALGESPDICLPVDMKTNILGDYLDQSGPLNEIDGETDDLAFAIAISGGSFRAANFAIGVLIGLEQLKYNLLKEVDYISTVSGGGYAAAVYISTLIDHLNRIGDAKRVEKEYKLSDYVKGSMHKRMGYTNGNYPKKLLREGFKGKTVTGNLKSLIYKTGITENDIASVDYLEEIYDNDMLGYKRRKKITKKEESLLLKDIFQYKTLAGDTHNKFNRVPYWIMNASIVETGELMPFTPDILKAYNVTGCMHREKPYELNEARDTLPVAVGVAASAAFPVIISPLTLECNYENYKTIHLIDGGLLDNLGGYTAVTLLMQDKRPRKLLLIIDAFNSFDIPFRQVVHESNKRKLIETCKSLNINFVCLDFEILEDKHIYKKIKSARTAYHDVSLSKQNILIKTGKMVVKYRLDEIKAILPKYIADEL